MHFEETIAELKEELHESAFLGVEECKQANELKRRNAELERELLELKTLSPASAASFDWRAEDSHRSLRKRASATSSEGGIPGVLRKKAMAAQFDEDLDEFMRENAQLKEQASRAERAKRELEEKLREVEMAKPASNTSSPAAGGLKVGLQVQHKAREIHLEKVTEDLKQEVEAEKLQVAALKEDIRKVYKKAAAKEERLYQELQEEKAARAGELQETQKAHEKDLKRLRKDLEAARFQLLATNFRSSPGLAPPSPGGERLNSILSARSDDGEPSPFDFDTGTGTADASLADELAGHFQWPTDQDSLQFRLPEEINELRIELQQMQSVQEGSSEAEEAVMEARAKLNDEAQELRVLRKECESSQHVSAGSRGGHAMPVQASRGEEATVMLNESTRLGPGPRPAELEGKLERQRQEIDSLKAALGDKAALLDKEVELQDLRRQLEQHGGTAKVLQSAKELTTFQQEVASMRKAAADAERRQAEVAELRDANASEVKELTYELAARKAEYDGRYQILLREKEQMGRTKPQVAVPSSEQMLPPQELRGPVQRFEHRPGREEAEVLKTLAALRFVDAHLYP